MMDNSFNPVRLLEILDSSEGVSTDSRTIRPGEIFFALKGGNFDGNAYAIDALRKGARFAVVDRRSRAADILTGGTEPDFSERYMLSDDTLQSLQELARLHRSRFDIPLILLTGTNGKTTTATLLYEMAKLFGFKAGLLSTVCNYIGEEKLPSTHTTPDALSINEYMYRMVEAGCVYCFMEVSSHSIHQKRIAGLDFDGAIFSNITHDHLDYHKTFRAYIEAKKAFFDGLPSHAFALTNADDKNGLVMLQNTKARKYTYSCRMMADFTCRIVERHLDGMLLKLNGQEVWTKFVGGFNAYNILAVYAASCLLGFDKEIVLKNVSLLVPVSGRFETLISGTGVMAIVDYAHTPDALENVLSTIKELIGKNNKIITVAGAGGDRDKTKRPEMAAVACQYSDWVILTSDNPRSEKPEDIIRDMRAGVKTEWIAKVQSITDRKQAIREAIQMAGEGDVVLVAGKGHENYQEIKGIKHHFDDKEVVREVFNEL